MDLPSSLSGKLLVAGPGLVDPNFARTVVLLVEHSSTGAVGVVLNRPTEADLLDHLPAWWSSAPEPRVVFIGGPVGEGGGLGLARGEGGVALGDWDEVHGVRALDLSEEPAEGDSLEVRVFAGYAGWGPGQLEDELEAGGWLVVDGRQEDVFTDAPEGLWAEVLRRAGGRYAVLATYPPDVRFN
jgi:putative transcriptional regulator